VAAAFGWAARSPLVSILTVIILLSRDGASVAALAGIVLALLLAAVQFTTRQGASEIVATWFYWTVAAGFVAEFIQLARARWGGGDIEGDAGVFADGFLAGPRSFITRFRKALREPGEQARLASMIQRAGAASILLAFAFIALGRPSVRASLAALAVAGVVPFAIWAARLAVVALSMNRGDTPVWRRGLAYAVAIVIIAGAEVSLPYIWRPPLPRSAVAFDFVTERGAGSGSIPTRPQVQNWLIGTRTMPALVMSPTAREPARVTYEIQVPAKAELTFAVGVAPETWEQSGDGVTFIVLADSPRGVASLFNLSLTPKNRPQDRVWRDVRLSLAQYAGETLKVIFIVQAGPSGDARFDRGGWAEPILWRTP
jgi:hypothetical protein